MLLLHRALASVGGAAGATLSYDFTGGTLPSGVTLTRSSSATYFNSSGVLVSASSDVARFNYDPVTLALRGLLIEPAATNINKSSADFSNAAYYLSSGTATVTTDTTSAPDGATTADTIALGASATDQRYMNASGFSLSTSTTYTWSVWIRSVSGTVNCRLKIYDGAGGADTYSSNLSVTTTWQRFSQTKTTNGSNASGANCAISNESGGGSKSIVVWGAQLETGSVATSNIATSGANGSRSADVCSFTIPSGVTTLRYTFDDNSTQDVSVSAGSYTIPTNLNRPNIKSVVSV